ncbi:MAG TPA: hypothetical protein VGN24_02660, partial [Rhodanobacter sp.]|nr:hypothetical protein [Rhodanobacter sp.]
VEQDAILFLAPAKRLFHVANVARFASRAHALFYPRLRIAIREYRLAQYMGNYEGPPTYPGKFSGGSGSHHSEIACRGHTRQQRPCARSIRVGVLAHQFVLALGKLLAEFVQFVAGKNLPGPLEHDFLFFLRMMVDQVFQDLDTAAEFLGAVGVF